LISGDEQFRAWAEIDYSIQTGKIAFEKVYGKPIFDYLGKNPDKARIFDAAMVGIHGRESDVILSAYDFSGVGVVADIGGGNGSQISQILEQHTGLKGILFDLPHVIERAKDPTEAAGLSDRCELVRGNFFDAVPEGADVYMMRHIIHDWDVEKSLTILRNCHRAMPASAKLLIVESVIPPGNEPFGGKLLDLVMLLIPGGKERTEDEYRTLLGKAGFDITQVIPTNSEVSISRSRGQTRSRSRGQTREPKPGSGGEAGGRSRGAKPGSRRGAKPWSKGGRSRGQTRLSVFWVNS